MVFITLFYTHRSINYLTLNKGGKYLTIETYKVPGLENKFKVPLNQVMVRIFVFARIKLIIIMLKSIKLTFRSVQITRDKILKDT